MKMLKSCENNEIESNHYIWKRGFLISNEGHDVLISIPQSQVDLLGCLVFFQPLMRNWKLRYTNCELFRRKKPKIN